MTFREKSAWISFLTILVIFGFYFVSAFGRIGAGETHGMEMVRLLMVSIAAFVGVQIVLHGVIAALAPKESDRRTDERESLISLKATRIAFFVLVAGALGAAASLHLGADKFVMANAMFFAVVLAELVRSGSQIVYFRRGV